MGRVKEQFLCKFLVNNAAKNSSHNSESRIQNAAIERFKTTINLVDELNLFLLLYQILYEDAWNIKQTAKYAKYAKSRELLI